MYYERLAEKELIEDNWTTQRAPPPNRYSKQTDLFGLFDILAIRQIEKEFIIKTYNGIENYHSIDPTRFSIIIQEQKYIQVKTNYRPNKEWMEKAKQFKETLCGENSSVEVWIYWQRRKRKNKKGWEKIII